MRQWEDYENEDGGYDLWFMPDQVLLGLADGYDDPRIDAVLYEYVKLKKLTLQRKPMELVTLVGGTKLVTHNRDVCMAPCPIHSPSQHRMITWRQNWRSDRGIMERLCVHGVGHPDPDDLLLRTGQDAGTHGCDGCCFPTV
jgi:hypothetical protein